MDLKVGDIVKLKTGGPNMTVNRVGPHDPTTTDDVRLLDGDVEAIWFTERDETATSRLCGWSYVTTQRFGADALVRVEP